MSGVIHRTRDLAIGRAAEQLVGGLDRVRELSRRRFVGSALLGAVTLVFDRCAAGCQIDRAHRVRHAWRRQHVEEVAHLARIQTGLLDQFASTGFGGVLAGYVTHSGRDLDDRAVVRRTVLTDEHDRGHPLRVEDQGNDADGSRRANDVASEQLPIGRFELGDDDVPDVALMYMAVAEVPNFARFVSFRS